VTLDLLPDLFLMFLLVLVPGAGICLVTRVTLGRPFLSFLALSFGIGYAAVALIALSIALVGLFSPAVFAGAWFAVSASVWLHAYRRRARGPLALARAGSGLDLPVDIRVERHHDGWRRHATADPWTTVISTIVILGIAAARWTVAPVANLAPTALRYWADALELADGGRIPEHTLQWGSLFQPTISKVSLNAFNAGAATVLGRDPIEPMGILLFVVTIGLVVISIALLGELGMRRLAPVGAMLLFANQVIGSELTADLGRNLAENWGRLAAFSAVLATILALRTVPTPEDVGRPQQRDPDRLRRVATITAGVLLAVAAGTHLVAAAFAAAAIVAFGVASLMTRVRVRDVIAYGCTILGLATVVGLAILTFPPGDIGFKGAVEPSAYDELRADLGLPAGFDPTRFIVTGEVEPTEEEGSLGAGDVLRAFAYRVAGRNVAAVEPGTEPSLWGLILPSATALGLFVLLFLRGGTDLRMAAATSLVLTGIMLTVGIAFALRYDLFALEAFGNRRLFNYAAVPYVILLTAGGELLLRAVGKRTSVVSRRLAPVAGFTLAAVCATVMLPSATWAHTARLARLEEQVELLRWVGDHVPCEGRVLADRRTLGTFEAVSGRAAVLEGMGPHIRPTVLARAIKELFRAREFFLHPRLHRGFLSKRGVAAIVLTNPPNRFGGWSRLVKPRPDLFDVVEYLEPVFRNDAGTVYFVDRFRAHPTLPRIDERPGFDCGTS
jgi:hypothetical protein